MKNVFSLFGIFLLFGVLFFAGCATQDVRTSLQFARLGSNAASLSQTWDGNRLILEKYRDLLQEGDPERKAVSGLIVTGDFVRADLEALAKGERVPTLLELRILFLEADEAVQTGRALYKRYEEYISNADKYRARVFSQTWEELRTDIEGLDRATTQNERAQIAKEILSFVLMVTGQVVVPSLRVAGTI